MADSKPDFGKRYVIDARYRVPIKEDPQRVARRRRIEQLLEEQQARKEDPLCSE
jgi:hypothetical protein